MGKGASWRRAKQPEEPTIRGCGRCQGSSCILGTEARQQEHTSEYREMYVESVLSVGKHCFMGK